MMTDLDLDTRQIINYLRKNTSDNKNEQYIRKILYSLFYSSYLDFPIAILNNEEELKYIYSELPYIFQKKNRNEIIDIYNKYVKPKKQILFTDINELYDYEINSFDRLEININTFRPVYIDNWREIASNIHKIDISKQYSFYNDYIIFYIKYKRFPTLAEYLQFIYNKYKKPLHKDIIVVYYNIYDSYDNVRKHIYKNNLSYKDVKKILVNSANITNRKKIQSL